MQKTLLILDSYKYKQREPEIRRAFASSKSIDFFYTDYENRLIRLFHRTGFAGNMLSHAAYWLSSMWSALKIFSIRRGYGSKLFINPIVGFFYCLLLSVLGIRENVCIAGFLFEDKASDTYYAIRKKIVAFVYRNTPLLVVYSRAELDNYSRIFPRLADKFVFVQYGRDFDIFEENEFQSRDEYVASGGSSNRDYATLSEAFAILHEEGLPIMGKIATRPSAFSMIDAPSNIEVLYDIRLDTFGSFLQNSLFVVISLEDRGLSAGHMVLLESMRLGKPTIITDIPAVRDYVDENDVFFYKSKDSASLASRIKHVYDNLGRDEILKKAKAAKASYDRKYTFVALVGRLSDLCDSSVPKSRHIGSPGDDVA